MSGLQVVVAVVFGIIIWILYPKLLAPIDFLVNSAFTLFLGRLIGSVIGGVMLTGLLFGSINQSKQTKQEEQQVLALGTDDAVAPAEQPASPSEPKATAVPAAEDPDREKYYFASSIMGFNLGMTVPELRELLVSKGKKLPSPTYNIHQVQSAFESYADEGWAVAGVSKEDLQYLSKTFYRCGIGPLGQLCYRLERDELPEDFPATFVELAFVGGRLCAFYGLFDGAYDALVKKYEVLNSGTGRYGWDDPDRDRWAVISVDGKPCLISSRYELVINVPYAKALISEMKKREAQEQNKGQQEATDAANRI